MKNLETRIAALEEKRRLVANVEPVYTCFDFADGGPGEPVPGVIVDPSRARIRIAFDFSVGQDSDIEVFP